ncbi:hypothetical protein F511_41767 [Dorcoceras hygrometricum]|uniref:Uncharacterized protein n=1 Tax=Dorcoceras hygrometricum TaxID=472368 RepID=A0A2Z7CCB5_9LAMI|nr:hypothetical protein F511_41767 [Dorcoceras hygrometricum]
MYLLGTSFVDFEHVNFEPGVEETKQISLNYFNPFFTYARSQTALIDLFYALESALDVL